MSVLAYLCLVLKCVIYGSTVLFTANLTENADVLDVLAIRFLLTFGLLTLLKSARVIRVSVTLRDLLLQTDRRQNVKGLLLAGLFEPVLYMTFEALGISMSSTVTVGVILSLTPVASILVEALVLKEKCPPARAAFLLLGIVGALIITFNTNTANGSDSVPGILFIFLAVIAGAMFTAFSRRSSKAFAPFEITYVSAFLGMTVFNAANLARHIAHGTLAHYFDPLLTANGLVGFAFLAFVSSVAAVFMANYALARLPISTAAAFTGLSTLVTVLLGVFVRHEPLYAYHAVGFSLILIRIVGVIAVDRRIRVPKGV